MLTKSLSKSFAFGRRPASAVVDPYAANVVSLIVAKSSDIGVVGAVDLVQGPNTRWVADYFTKPIGIADADFSTGAAISFVYPNNSISCPVSTTVWRDIGTQDFCFEMIGKFYSALNPLHALFSNFSSVGLEIQYPTNYLSFYAGGQRATASVPIVTGVPLHIAVVRSGTSLKIYQNGVEVASQSIGAGVSCGSNNAMWIGRDNGGMWGGMVLHGWRATIGVPRYTGNFTPPTAAFPNP
jgi:hypothetical protein